MTDQLDLSLLAGISDPELRSSLERLGNAMQDGPARLGARDAIIGQDHPVSAVPRSNAPGGERHGAQRSIFVCARQG